MSSLTRLRTLTVRANNIQLGSSCGQLAALRELCVLCGTEKLSADRNHWIVTILSPSTVTVQPGAIPPGLTMIHFGCCSMQQLPAALSAASGLKQLRLDSCCKDWLREAREAPELQPTLGCLRELETLQLRRLHLEYHSSLLPLLAGPTGLRHLDVAESDLSEGSRQSLVSACPQTSALTCLSLAGADYACSLQAEPGAWPSLRELRIVLPPECDDQRLQLLTAAAGVQHLTLSASALFCEANLEMLAGLPHLRDLAVV